MPYLRQQLRACTSHLQARNFVILALRQLIEAPIAADSVPAFRAPHPAVRPICRPFTAQ
jgi:hypothetical protein